MTPLPTSSRTARSAVGGTDRAHWWHGTNIMVRRQRAPTTASCASAATSPASALDRTRASSRRGATPSPSRRAGAKAIAVDPDAARIADRSARRAERAEVHRPVPPERPRRPRLRHQRVRRSRRRLALARRRRRPAAACCARCTACCKPSMPFVRLDAPPGRGDVRQRSAPHGSRYGAGTHHDRRAVHGLRAQQLPPRHGARTGRPSRPRAVGADGARAASPQARLSDQIGRRDAGCVQLNGSSSASMSSAGRGRPNR